MAMCGWAFERKYREKQAELAAVRRELAEARSRYGRELDEPPRKRARGGEAGRVSLESMELIPRCA